MLKPSQVPVNSVVVLKDDSRAVVHFYDGDEPYVFVRMLEVHSLTRIPFSEIARIEKRGEELKLNRLSKEVRCHALHASSAENIAMRSLKHLRTLSVKQMAEYIKKRRMYEHVSKRSARTGVNDFLLKLKLEHSRSMSKEAV